MSRNIWKIYLLGGGILLGLYLLYLPLNRQAILLTGFGVLGILAAIAGLWTYRPQPLAVWILMLFGQLFDSLGDVFFTNVYYLRNLGTPVWVISLFYLLGTFSFVGGIVVLSIKFRHLIQRNAVLNGLIAATAICVIVWVIQIAPNLSRSATSEEWIAVIAYPIGVIVVGVLCSLFLMTPLGHTWCYRSLYVSLLFFVFGLFFYDKVVSYPLGSGMLPDVWWATCYDFSYSGAYLFLGAAMLHPSIKTLGVPLPNKESEISLQDVLVLALAFLVGPLAFWIQSQNGIHVDVLPVLIGMIIIFSLVEIRLVLLVRAFETQNRRLGHQQIQLKHQASHDLLTGLPNRLYLDTYLTDAGERTLLSRKHIALLMIDLDNFKMVNDTFGHHQGDIVLRQVADQFTQMKRRNDMVGRWGGDEFVFILEEIDSVGDAIAFAQRLYREVRIFIEGENSAVLVTLSIGGSVFPNNSNNIEMALKEADDALYRAKAGGQEHISFCDHPAFVGVEDANLPTSG